MSGEFNYKFETLVDLSLALNNFPQLTFVSKDAYFKMHHMRVSNQTKVKKATPKNIPSEVLKKESSKAKISTLKLNGPKLNSIKKAGKKVKPKLA
ncbi:MAG: hypothetical protein H7296_11080 [Bacteroidia bacterium]|nr:hypothetical protein [Bacteroidia bacterium]